MVWKEWCVYLMIKPNNVYLGDCYELIKQIPDKSIDLIYTDIPYEFNSGGGGGAFGNKKRPYRDDIKFENEKRKEKLILQAQKYKDLMDNAKDKDEYEKYHCMRGNIQKKINYRGIDTGIDYDILDEYVRVLKYIYIYMV